MSRILSRKLAVFLLYSADINDDFSRSFFDDLINNYPEDDITLSDDNLEFLYDLIEGVSNNIEEIDKKIAKFSEGWSVDRIGRIEMAILREAIYEICYRGDVPVEVVANEAVEIAKKYGREEAFRFINGILASVIKEIDS